MQRIWMCAPWLLAGWLASVPVAGWAAPVTVPAPAAVAGPEGEPPVPVNELRRFAQVYEQVRRNYVDEVPDERLFDQALRGLLEGLDPYSDYLDAKSYSSLVEFTEGELAHSGLTLKNVSGQWQIDRVDAQSAALRQGLKAGDVVTRLDGKSLKNLTQRDVDQLMRGPAGSTLVVGVAGPRSREVRLQRLVPDIQPVQGRLDDGIAVIGIHAFQAQTAQQVLDLLDDWQNKAQLKGILLDLRDNPGGLLATAVDLGSNLLSNGRLIVYTKGRGEPEQRYQSLSSSRYTGVPITVLINHYSASAAEVLAGALQDHQAATIVGETSYGKGSVQKLWPLGDGRAIKMTVARYYTPNGRQIEGKGIQPDIEIPAPASQLPDSHDAQIQEAIRLLRARLPVPPPVAVPAPGPAPASKRSPPRYPAGSLMP